MSTHNIGFSGEIRKILTRYPLLSRPMSIMDCVLALNIYFNCMFRDLGLLMYHREILCLYGSTLSIREP